MSIDPGINDLLQGGGKSYSWDEAPLNTVHRLTVTAAKKVQQTDYVTKKPKFYDDGNPMMQIAVTGDTEERDPEIPGDEGVRVEYFYGQKLSMLREVLQKQRVTLAVGGKLAVKLMEVKKLDNGMKQNIFAVQYTAPPEPAFDPSEEPF